MGPDAKANKWFSTVIHHWISNYTNPLSVSSSPDLGIHFIPNEMAARIPAWLTHAYLICMKQYPGAQQPACSL